MIEKVIPKWMFNRIKEKFEVSSLEDLHKLTDEQLLSVPMFGKMRLQRLRSISKQEQPIDVYSYNKGVHDAVLGICRLITDNYKKCITPRECEILLHEDDLKKKY